MAEIKIISKEELYKMFDEEEKSKKYYLDLMGEKEVDGTYCSLYKDTRTGITYASKTLKSVHMGFNSNEEGKLEELIATVEKYGEASASWGVTGRTMHEILAEQLKAQLTQYRFEIGYNYKCEVYKK